jgi:hypothetical protein
MMPDRTPAMTARRPSSVMPQSCVYVARPKKISSRGRRVLAALQRLGLSSHTVLAKASGISPTQMPDTLNLLWELRLIRFLPGDLVALMTREVTGERC